MSIRSTIVAAAITALNTGRPAGVPAASVLLVSQLEAASHPTLAVYPGNERIHQATNRSSPLVVREMELIIECRVTGNDPAGSLDPMIMWATKQLAGLRNANFHDIVEKELVHRFEVTSGSLIGMAQLKFQVNYQTRRDDQSVTA